MLLNTIDKKDYLKIEIEDLLLEFLGHAEDPYSTSKRIGFYMGLNSHQNSENALEFSKFIAERLWLGLKHSRTKPGAAFIKAVGIILADLLKAVSINHEIPCYRSMGSNSFSYLPVGYVRFKSIMDELTRQCLVKRLKHIPPSFKNNMQGLTTRFVVSNELVDIAKLFSIDPENWLLNFKKNARPASIGCPVTLRSPSEYRFIDTGIGKKRAKVLGNRISFDKTDPIAIDISNQVNDLNEFFSKQDIIPDEHDSFVRKFSMGKESGYKWNKGGRLYSEGYSYQQMKSDKRAEIKINGESTVEIDIQASHLTLYHGLRKWAFDPTKDPYTIPDIPRHVVKSWITMTLGNDKFQTRWSENARDAFKQKTGLNLQEKYPIAMVRDKILDHLPILKDWPEYDLDWADLQFIESEIIIGTMYELAMMHGVPALPVHDSLIVPASKEALAIRILAKEFERRAGITPYIAKK
ncbi:hypothetical protein [Sphingomonas sp. MM-1]|uniref:hypothetical protein n=1 Tax=Sphingomonas sp. MM-1 TaxID=745310 RepID=UPI000A67FF74|nr:hypothetical protein [Sphingomonas sp. MM-1]